MNRISLGAQSFDDATLRRLGRAHRAGACRATLDAVRAAGFERLSIDLIAAAPGQGLGLSILKETVELYAGEIAFSRSQLGGLKARLRLPATD